MIARISGIALSPGVSRNNRLYTAETIARAVVRAQARIAEGVRPVSMRTHHAADDDSTRLTGHVSEMTLDPTGRARFGAVIEGNPAGRAIAALADNRDGPPSLRGLSIRGAWLGPVRTVVVDGRQCETADDLEIVGLDFTAEPGVDDAGVEHIDFVGDDAGAEESAAGVERHLITESAEEASVTITEQNPVPTPPAAAAVAAPPARVVESGEAWADRGYHGAPCFPLNTAAQARAAWVAIGESAGSYTAPQNKRMRGRVKSALGRFGITLTDEGWLVDTPRQVTEAGTGGAVTEYWYDDNASVYITISNGPLSISVSSYDVAPDALGAVARAAMLGACQALAVMDGDGADEASADAAAVETEASAGPVTEAAAAADDAPTADPAAGTATTEEAAMGEPETTAATPPAAAPSITLTGEQFGQLLDRIAPAAAPATPGAAETAPAAGVAEATPGTAAAPAAAVTPVAETDDARIARLVQEGITAGMATMRTQLVQEIAQAYPPARRGLVEAAGEPGTAPEGLPEGLPQKALHTYTDIERAGFDRTIAAAVLGPRGLMGTTTS